MTNATVPPKSPSAEPPPVWRVPAPNLLQRWLNIGCGLAVLIWLGVEDDSVLPALLLGMMMTALGIAHPMMRARAGTMLSGTRAIAGAWTVLGLMVGGLTPSAAVILLAFKDATHAHSFPDAPAELLADVLALTPTWGIAGALIGIGLYAGWRAQTLR